MDDGIGERMTPVVGGKVNFIAVAAIIAAVWPGSCDAGTPLWRPQPLFGQAWVSIA